MAPERRSRVLVIGVGNPFRRDDRAGWEVARLIKEMGCRFATVVEHSGEGAALMEAWKDADAVIVIDAVSAGAPSGTVHRLEPLLEPLPAVMFRGSTHAFSVPEAIELSRALNQLPGRLLVFGIEGQDFQAGTEISPDVAAVLHDVARLVLEQLSAWEKEKSGG